MPVSEQEIEIWKTIELRPFDEFYEVSNLGFVRSKDRIVVDKNGVEKKIKGRCLKPVVSHYGYYKCTLCVKNQKKICNIHRLVAQAFISNIKSKATINHKDGDKSNNRVDNLEWATHSENHLHACRVLNRVGNQTGKFGKNHVAARKIIQVSKAGEIVKVWGSVIDAARTLNFKATCLSKVCAGKGKSAYGFKWHYANEAEIAQLKKSESPQ